MKGRNGEQQLKQVRKYVSWQKTRMQTKQGTVNENSSHCVDYKIKTTFLGE
jgi:phage-related baseplate assembly protein